MNDVEAVASQVDQLLTGDRSAAVQPNVAALLDGLEGDTILLVETWARDALRETPTPLRPAADSHVDRRRAILTRLAAEAAACDGRPDELLRLLLCDWRDDGESPANYIEHLVAFGREAHAAVTARYVLSREGCPDRERIQAALERLGSPPQGWQDAVLAFAGAPSVEAWEELMQFTPADAVYYRTRNTIQMLIALGVDGDVLFRCATRYGSTPDAFELVELGLVDPETILERGRSGPATARGIWFGLAARAALVRGDRFRAVRLLREALEIADPAFPPLTEVWAIRGLADDELHAMLDSAGIPRR